MEVPRSTNRAYQNGLTVVRGRGVDNGYTACPWYLLAETLKVVNDQK